MSAPKKLSEAVEAVLVKGIGLHTQAASCSLGQARELVEEEDGIKRQVAEGKGDESSLQLIATLATQRAVHELEAAFHASMLTQIGLTLGLLEAAGVSVDSLFAEMAEARARHPEE